jgi:PAS domain S-box-containing protein
MGQPEPYAIQHCRWFAQLASITAIVIGCLVLVGWALGLDVVTTVITNGIAMKPLTAACFILAGFALLIWRRTDSRFEPLPRRAPTLRLIARLLAGLVVVVGLAVLAEIVLSVDLGIDRLVFPDAILASADPRPGRMAALTALTFVVLGVALLLTGIRVHALHSAGQYLALIAALSGLIGFQGNLYGESTSSRLNPYVLMSIHTSVLFMMLGLGVVAVRPTRGLMAVVTTSYSGGLMARRLLPVAIVLPILFALPRLLGERAGLYDTEAGVTLHATALIVSFTVLVWFSARSLNRIDVERQRLDEATRRTAADLRRSNQQLQAEIAERQLAEVARRVSEERFLKAFHANPAGMVYARMVDRRYVEVNQSWLAMTGYERDDVIGRTFEEVGLLVDEDRAFVMAGLQAAGGFRDRDVHYRGKNGEVRDGLISGQALYVDGEAYSLTILIDITARVQAEERLRESNRRLEETLVELRAAQQQIVEHERISALGQLASGIAHDFNNALGPILGYSDLLLSQPELLDDPVLVAEQIRSINTAAQDAAHVVSRLRDFYRRRETSDVFEPLQLADLIAQAISLTRPRWRDEALADGVAIKIETDVADVPPINGHASELREALTNLVLNAIDALPAGGTITLRAHSADGQAILEVADTGIGMTDEVRKRCLEPFFTTKGERGTGLGLGMVHAAVVHHEGTLEIDSTPGVGTTMRLLLPVRVNGEPVGQPVPPEQRAGGPLRVLVVDDEPLIRQVISGFLHIDRHAVKAAGSGQEALALLGSETFDLVITDRAMPDMGGDELAVTVKASAPTVPVIMLTGFGELMDVTGQRPGGVDLVVGKPITLAGLRAAVAAVVGEPSADQ